MSRISLTRKALPFAVALLCGLGVSAPVSARSWKQSPQAAALEYSQIVDNRDKDLHFVWWLSSPSFPDAPGVGPMLDKYFILAVAHGKMDATLDVTFVPVEAPVVKDAGGKTLRLLKDDELAPGATALLSGLKSLLPRMIGPMGKGMEMFVYEPGGVEACKAGKVSVVMPQETYTFDTPLPGCP